MPKKIKIISDPKNYRCLAKSTKKIHHLKSANLQGSPFYNSLLLIFASN